MRRVDMPIQSDQPLPDDLATLQAMVRELLDKLAAVRRDNAALQDTTGSTPATALRSQVREDSRWAYSPTHPD